VFNVDFLQSYVEKGWRLFPVHSYLDGICTCDDSNCGNPGKHPLTPNGFHDATLDIELIQEWHSETLGLSNWGLATGPGSGVWVLDADGALGLQTLAELQAQHGALHGTPTVGTGGGGKHFYFAWSEGVKSRVRFAPGLDTRGEGGYVLVPPSLHASGKRYEWLTPHVQPLAEAPPWLLALVRERVNAEALASGGGLTLTVREGTQDLTNSPGVSKGTRNAILCQSAGVHLARGESLEQVEAKALAWAATCNPPYPEGDTIKTVRALWKKHQVTAGVIRTNELISAATDRVFPFVRSLATAQAGGGAKGEGVVETSSPYPTLHPDAYHGLAGTIVKAVEPETVAVHRSRSPLSHASYRIA
jgi:hypothetical protein